MVVYRVHQPMWLLVVCWLLNGNYANLEEWIYCGEWFVCTSYVVAACDTSMQGSFVLCSLKVLTARLLLIAELLLGLNALFVCKKLNTTQYQRVEGLLKSILKSGWFLKSVVFNFYGHCPQLFVNGLRGQLLVADFALLSSVHLCQMQTNSSNWLLCSSTLLEASCNMQS